MKKIVIAGGTGLVGQALSKRLNELGYEVYILSRKKNPQGFLWNPSQHYIEEGALDQTFAVINLAGAGVANQFWTPKRKKIITDSRVFAAETFEKAFEKASNRPEVYLSAGAIGYYGNRGEEWLRESDQSGSDFLAKSCVAWENAVQRLKKFSIRLTQFRIGIVLSALGGAYKKIHLPYQFGCAAYFGNGNMWYSWIHIQDLVEMMIHALENPKIEGIYNAVAPYPVTNKELVIAMKKEGSRPAILCPIPSLLLKLIIGEMSAVILSSARISSEKITATNYKFSYPSIDLAMKELKP